MRINIYGEELTDRFEHVTKEVDGVVFHGVRMYLYMPVTMDPQGGTRFQAKGPFIHREGDDDSSAVTIWSNSLDQLIGTISMMRDTLKVERAKPRHCMLQNTGKPACIVSCGLHNCHSA